MLKVRAVRRRSITDTIATVTVKTTPEELAKFIGIPVSSLQVLSDSERRRAGFVYIDIVSGRGVMIDQLPTYLVKEPDGATAPIAQALLEEVYEWEGDE